MEAFPYHTEVDVLEKKDFIRFSGLFSSVISGAVPAVTSVLFVEDTTPFSKIFSKAGIIKKVTGAFQQLRKGDQGAIVAGGTILFGFPLAHGGFIAAVIPQVDEVVLERVADDWLQDVLEGIGEEFLAIKRQYQDAETGLLNTIHLNQSLAGEGMESDLGLLLVEMSLPRRAGRDVFRSVQRAAASLSVYSDSRILLHHLGQSIFGLLVKDNSGELFESLSAGIVQQMKKEGFSRVHIGMCRGADINNGAQAPNTSTLLDGAWTALKIASRRGPFSFCDYTRLANSDVHPLKVGSASIVRRIQRLSKKDRSFCLVKLSPLDHSVDISEVLTLVGGEGVYCIIDDDRSPFLYLSEYGPDQAGDYAGKLLVRLKKAFGQDNLYGGITYYPYSDFSRNETINNVQKALLHAAFFGAGSVVQFEALSLNVSGDVYFGEGDLPKAVTEYKRGLVCDCNDVNLLNSLGVTYALLGRSGLARQTFEQALAIETDNYMALYNLGLGAQQRGDDREAIRCFELAGEYCDGSEEAQLVKKDMTYQLGILYCQEGRYKDALTSLHLWAENAADSQRGKVYKYLGEAYLGAGENQQAMTWLQRALQHNEFDGEAMALLGSVIMEQGEGDEIALSLCRKGVELCPDNPLLWYRLAEVQLQNTLHRETLHSLKHCNTKTIEKGSVHLLKARTYLAMGQKNSARRWVKEVLHNYPLGSEHYREAETLHKRIGKEG